MMTGLQSSKEGTIMTLLEISQRLDALLDKADIECESTMKALEELNNDVYDAAHYEGDEEW